VSTVSITGLDKADVLAALYNAAAPIGLGVLRYREESMTREQAQALIDAETTSYGVSFDYVHGRPLKIDLTTDELRTDLYNRDQGMGAAERVVAELRKAKVSQ